MLVNHYFQLKLVDKENTAADVNENWIAVTANWFSRLYENTFVRWVQRLYLAWKWHFLDPPDVCAALTGSPASFWEQHLPECQDRISRDFTAWVVYAECLVLVLLYVRLCCCWRGGGVRVRTP